MGLTLSILLSTYLINNMDWYSKDIENINTCVTLPSETFISNIECRKENESLSSKSNMTEDCPLNMKVWKTKWTETSVPESYHIDYNKTLYLCSKILVCCNK
jgi:hypothetical protein